MFFNLSFRVPDRRSGIVVSRYVMSLMLAMVVIGISATARAEVWDYDRIVTLEAGPDVPFQLKELFLTVQPGTVIELPEGTYEFDDELILNQSHITIRGKGMDRTVLSFKNQPAGAEGILVQGDAFAALDFAIEDTKGDGLKIENARGVMVKGVRVEWTNGPDETNGAYGFYPINCEQVLIEDSVVIGASDAGIYVGQSKEIIVRRNRAEYNVAGIEIENSINADVYENLATNNTGGILVFDMPNLPQAGHHTRVFNNRAVSNNTRNFAPEGNIVGKVPTGTGVMVLSTDWVHVFDNEITDNNTVNFTSVSFKSISILDDTPLPDTYDPYPEHIYVYDNLMDKNYRWYVDSSDFSILVNLLFLLAREPMTDSIVDGFTRNGLADADWCFQNNRHRNGSLATFGNMHLDKKHWLLGLLGIPGLPADVGYPPETNCTQPDFGPVALDFSVYETVPDPEEEYTEEEIAEICAGGDQATVNWSAYIVNCPTLSGYRLFTDASDPRGELNTTRALPYDLTTPLFSDYAKKDRSVFVPEGSQIIYNADSHFDFPIGSIIVKTFTLPLANGNDKVVETRLFIHRESGWFGVTYIWADDMSEAYLAYGGGEYNADIIDPDGNVLAVNYRIPNMNQCTNCHGARASKDDSFANRPIGPKARMLNKNYDYGTRFANQLDYWASVGLLSGAPDATEAPRLPVWDDESDGTEEQRARTYLEINCAHCHSAEGRAHSTGLHLLADTPLDAAFGLCKPPVAAGTGSGGLKWDIVPGNADESIVVYRMESNDPAVRMPELGRSITHSQGNQLVKDWINHLPGTCDTEE
ncbi:MAG: right-handed parallel beta-helix repeat-containing protein [Pseudomonadales bacterium]|nr:right-handed parallel beta-helix repeat-containing protein [Pseudomonadales bacterium]